MARFYAPFGAVEQREIQALRKVEARPHDIVVLVALRLRSGPDGWCRDGLDSLARWSLLGRRSVQRSAARLRRWGVVADQRIPQAGGPQGTAWTYRRKVLPFSEWPENLRIQSSSSLNGEDDSELVLSTKRMPTAVEESARNEGRGRLATRDNPESYPEIYPDSQSGTSSRDDGNGTTARATVNGASSHGKGTNLEGDVAAALRE